MPHSLYDWLDRIKAVEREYLAVWTSLGQLRGAIVSGIAASVTVKVRDLDSAMENLEGTYLIRIWAEFETAIRSYHCWRTSDPEARIGTHDLINTVAGERRGRAISEDVRVAVHAIRDSRNTLVHSREAGARTVPLGDARRSLNTFLSKLPPNWD